jgi:ABC-type glutathione transport system ATPase component
MENPQTDDEKNVVIDLKGNGGSAMGAGSFLGEIMDNSNVERTEIEFSDLTMTLEGTKKRPKKIIMDGLSGSIRSGRLTALMGPSGSGKTS